MTKSELLAALAVGLLLAFLVMTDVNPSLILQGGKGA